MILMNHTQGSNREINRQKNSLDAQHRAKALESKCSAPSSLVGIYGMEPFDRRQNVEALRAHRASRTARSGEVP